MRFLGRFGRDTGGNIALIAAVVIPFLAMIGCGGIELAFLSLDKARMQSVADAAALSGAKELTLAMQNGAPERAKMNAEVQLKALAARSEVSIVAQTVQNGEAMNVAITSHRASFFGNLLPPGGFTVKVHATAVRMGRIPLCVLSSYTDASSGLRMDDGAMITAGNCLVHANSSVEVKGSAWLRAAAVQTVGQATGRITPEALVGAAAIEDPFASMPVKPTGSCSLVTDLLLNLGISLSAGTHCGNIVVHKGQTLRLAPGVHYFINGDLTLKEDAQLIGTDVVLVFDKNGGFSAKDNSSISLEGRKTGALAGFVIVTTHDNSQTFDISTDSAHKLLGTVYIPAATLQISGSGTKIADQSPWTVIVAKTIALIGTPNLVINANYAGSSVPVPGGVGPRNTGARLAD